MKPCNFPGSKQQRRISALERMNADLLGNQENKRQRTVVIRNTMEKLVDDPLSIMTKKWRG